MRAVHFMDVTGDVHEPLCRRVPNWASMVDAPNLVTCRRCLKLLDELRRKGPKD